MRPWWYSHGRLPIILRINGSVWRANVVLSVAQRIFPIIYVATCSITDVLASSLGRPLHKFDPKKHYCTSCGLPLNSSMAFSSSPDFVKDCSSRKLRHANCCRQNRFHISRVSRKWFCRHNWHLRGVNIRPAPNLIQQSVDCKSLIRMSQAYKI